MNTATNAYMRFALIIYLALGSALISGCTGPLVNAISANNAAEVRRLLDTGTKVNDGVYGGDLLNYAVNVYLPTKVRHWFERSLGRLFILDIVLTVIGMIGFSKVSDSLTAVIAASTLGLLGTFTTVGIRCYQQIRLSISKRKTIAQ